MQNDANANDPRSLWQSQEVVKVTITLDDVRRKASRFERRIHWRNVREYVAGAVTIAFFASGLGRFHGWRMAPPLLLIAAALFVMFQLYRRGSARQIPGGIGIMATIKCHRLELERQRDALRSVWLWYMLPFQPGFLAVAVVGAVDNGMDVKLVRYLVGLVIVSVLIWGLNECAARVLDRKIQEMSAMELSDG